MTGLFINFFKVITLKIQKWKFLDYYLGITTL